MRWRERERWWLIAAAGLLGGAAAAADPSGSGEPLYRWVDGHGQVHFSDVVPPEAVPREHQQIDTKGRTRKTITREKTASEADAEARAARGAAEQASYDRYLLQTYSSAAEIDAARTAQLKVLDSRRAAADKAYADSQATLADLHTRSGAAQSEGPEAVAKLQQEIASFEDAARQAAETRDKIDAERRASAIRFDADMKRYQMLRHPAAAS